jgi:hypothetical protein
MVLNRFRSPERWNRSPFPFPMAWLAAIATITNVGKMTNLYGYIVYGFPFRFRQRLSRVCGVLHRWRVQNLHSESQLSSWLSWSYLEAVWAPGSVAASPVPDDSDNMDVSAVQTISPGLTGDWASHGEQGIRSDVKGHPGTVPTRWYKWQESFR